MYTPSGYLKIAILFTILLVANSQFYGGRVEEPDSYSATSKPQDISGARAALGYDKYERQPVEHAPKNNKYPFGNNWEQFDKPNGQYNLPYSG